MSDRPMHAVSLLLAWELVACGGPRSATEASTLPSPPAASARAASPPTEPGSATVADAGSDATSPRVETTHSGGRSRVLRVSELPPESQSFDGPLGAAPCDLDRTYRGTIGKTPLTVLLAPGTTPGSLMGEVHYDRVSSSLPVERGGVALPALRFGERGGGLFEGECDPATGRISGNYTLQGKAERFELWPRPKGWPPLYRVSRKSVVAGNFPGCGKVAKPKSVTTASIPGDDYGYAICPPTDPDARREAIAQGGVACTASESALRVFGLPNAAAINRALEAASPYPQHLREIKKCWTLHSHDSVTWVMFANADLLTIQTGRSEDYGGAHPTNSTDEGIAIDLRRGKRVTLGDVVTSTDVLRDLTLGCAWDYLALEQVSKTGDVVADLPSSPLSCDTAPVRQLTWDCDPNERHELGPMWGLLGEGIAILSYGHPHALAVLDGRGPIISWSALARAGILKPGSPVEHLWRGVTPLPPAAPACTAAYVGGPTLLRWTVVGGGE